jgi:hypothetical protein
VDTVEPGSAEDSVLYRVIIGDDPDMPPEGPLPEPDIALIRAWIDGGAEGLDE